MSLCVRCWCCGCCVACVCHALHSHRRQMHLMWCDLRRDTKKLHWFFPYVWVGCATTEHFWQPLMLFLGAGLCLALSYVNNGMAGCTQCGQILCTENGGAPQTTRNAELTGWRTRTGHRVSLVAYTRIRSDKWIGTGGWGTTWIRINATRWRKALPRKGASTS